LYGQSLVIILPKLWFDISASVVLQFNFSVLRFPLIWKPKLCTYVCLLCAS
jgi:hypothetical protein